MERTLDIIYNDLVVGTDLSALFYSYIYNIPLIFINKNKNYESFKNSDVYNKLLYFLSISGLVIYGKNIYSSRIEDNILKLITYNNLLINIKFNKIYIFNDSAIEGLPIPIGTTSEENAVVDWFDVNSGGTHNIQNIKTEENFVNEIKFYISDRFYMDNTKKDCYSISYLSNEQLKLFEYSQTYCNFKVKKIMKDNGITGRFDKTNNTFKAIKLTSRNRVIYPLGKNIYENINDSIIFNYESWEDILKQDKKGNTYSRLLEEKFGIII